MHETATSQFPRVVDWEWFYLIPNSHKEAISSSGIASAWIVGANRQG